MKTANRLTPLERTQTVLDVSVTERDTFKTCRRRWELEVLENLEPKVPRGMELDFGSGLHAALEAYYNIVSTVPQQALGYPHVDPREAARMAWDDWYLRAAARIDDDRELTDNAKAEMHDELIDLGDLGEDILEGYFQFAKHEDRFTVHAIEGKLTGPGKSWLKKHFEEREFIADNSKSAVILDDRSGRLMCPILDPKTKRPLKGRPMLTTRIDLLVHSIEPGLKGLWVLDHKSTSRTPDDAALDFFDQATAMCYILYRWLGIIPRGIIWNYLMKRAPKEPKMIRKGKVLSTDKSQLTTAVAYRKAMRDLGLMLKDGTVKDDAYAETYEVFLSRGWDKFFQRHYTTKNVFQMEAFERRLYSEYCDMADAEEDEALIYPNFGPPHNCWCKGCTVAPICQALEDGGDVEDIIDTQYMQKPDRKAVKHW